MDRIIGLALPTAAQLSGRRARLLAAGLGLLIVLLLATAVNAFFGLGGVAVEHVMRDWVSSAVYILVAAIVALRAVCVPDKRVSWAFFAVGLSVYGAGNLLWSFWIEHLRQVPIPSICDGLWLTLYPLSYAGVVAFAASGGRRRLPAGVWLDGIVAGAGIAALGAALVFRPILASTTGGDVTAVATELAYPIGDFLLAALVVGMLALRGWRLDRAWATLGGGFLLLSVADCLYCVQVAGGSSSPSALTNLAYVTAVAVLAVAAWQPAPTHLAARLDATSALLLPAGFTTSALGLLLYDRFERLDDLAFGLAISTLVAATLRMILTFRDLRGLAVARHEAATDHLTSLPNRRLFLRRLATDIAAARVDGTRVWVLMLDLDNFKQLNDTLGHNAGDTLLRLIGPRLAQAVRSTDLVARLGGDEFGIILAPTATEAGALRVADKVMRSLRAPFDVEGLALRVTGSLGLASFPEHGSDTEELLKRADVAMYAAKATRNGYSLYTSERDSNSRERLAVVSELAEALESGGIEVHFQPKADAHTRSMRGAEALVRWRHHSGRLIPPGEFLPAAEQGGLSRALTRRVLTGALDQLREWRAAGHDIDVSVNVTAADLLDETFPAELRDALHRRGLPAESLVLEVTETCILLDPERMTNVLAQIGEAGVRLSLDDFGTGYSSLAHLKSLPVGEVKIDRSFVSRMCSDETDMAIVYATVQLAEKLGMTVVAEGVEDEATWQALCDIGCRLIQGYGFSRPLPAAELVHLLPARQSPADLSLGAAAQMAVEN